MRSQALPHHPNRHVVVAPGAVVLLEDVLQVLEHEGEEVRPRRGLRGDGHLSGRHVEDAPARDRFGRPEPFRQDGSVEAEPAGHQIDLDYGLRQRHRPGVLDLDGREVEFRSRPDRRGGRDRRNVERGDPARSLGRVGADQPVPEGNPAEGVPDRGGVIREEGGEAVRRELRVQERVPPDLPKIKGISAGDLVRVPQSPGNGEALSRKSWKR